MMTGLAITPIPMTTAMGPDAVDAFPLDPNETVDTDGDGIGNNTDPDDDGDGVNDVRRCLPAG